MPERIALVDCIGGISGDMFLAAAIDAGVECGLLEEHANSLGIGRIAIRSEKAVSGGLAGTRIEVVCPHEHAHRGLRDILNIIGGSQMSEWTKIRAADAFETLARAEAKVHGCEVEAIHFHEVGACDAIVDITGAFVALEALGVTEVYGSPVPAGSGTVRCAHGILPVPAPATLEILKGWPISSGELPGETVTPTGAVLLTRMTGGFKARPGYVPVNLGHGLGRREWPDRPNALRLVLAERNDEEAHAAARGDGEREHPVTVLECEIDDMNPELYGAVSARLFAAGALDVFTTPIYMKKGRPGVLLTVICMKEHADALTKVVFRETTTLGVRFRVEDRLCLGREWVDVEVGGARVRIKVGVGGGAEWPNLAPEYDDCLRAADETGKSVKEVYQKALAEASRRMDPSRQQR